MSLLKFTTKGIYCKQANVYLDPLRGVETAIITHAHSDHARYGNKFYISTPETAQIMKLRISPNINVKTFKYGEEFTVNDVNFSLHPAGHIIGSAQVRVEYKGEVWVYSGDYKLNYDGLSTQFEPVKCHTFITESTFGLPIFRWRDSKEVFNEMNEWWKENKASGKTTVILGYSLGKAQRIIQGLDPSIGKIFVHGAIDNTNKQFESIGLKFNDYTKVTKEIDKGEFEGSVIVAPPSALDSPWLRKFYPYSVANVSGWTAIRGIRRRLGVDRGFTVSDHADWDELNTAVKETGAQRVFVTHGYKSVFAKYLNEQGIEAHDIASFDYGTEADDDEEAIGSGP